MAKQQPRRVWAGASQRERRLRVEHLEGRRLLSVVTVDTELDVVNPTDGLTSLREAIITTNASPGPDEIVFDFGHDGPAIIVLDHGELEITEALTITGDGPELLTIDAQEQSRIFNITAYSGDFKIARTTITGGRTTGDTSNYDFYGTYNGGAIRSSSFLGDLTIEGSIITRNSTAGSNAHGGGVFTNGDVKFIDSVVADNSTAGSNAEGGGVRASGSVALNNSTVSGNRTLGNNAVGGGVRAGQSATLTHSIVSGNSTAGSDAEGGGVSASSVTLTHSTVSGNSTEGSDAEGGGVRAAGPVTLINSTISGNRTLGNNAVGGGVRAGSVTLTHSTIADNRVMYLNASGGGIWSADVVTIAGSIVAGNTAGDGNHDVSSATGNLTVEYSLIGDNTGTDLVEAQTADAAGNLIGSATGAGVIDPLLGSLGDNGGPTKTHALLLGSPAIDAGDNALAIPAGLALDQRGLLRAADGGSNGVIIVDMGAYELNATAAPATLVVDTTIDEFDFNFEPLHLSLREAVGLSNGRGGPDTIIFDNAGAFAHPQTITLTLGEMKLSDEATINGPGRDLLTIDAQQRSRIFNITATTGVSTIAGLTVTGGKTDTRGGGISASGQVILRDSAVTANMAGSYGGGVSVFGDASLINSTVSGNSTNSGGGVFVSGESLLIDSVVSDNTATIGNGGGIRHGGSFTMVGSTISGNSATNGSGGGIWTYDDLGLVTISNSTVSGNTAGSFGGIVAFERGMKITNSTITGNTANDFGGVSLIGIGTLSISHSIIAGNSGGPNSADVKAPYAPAINAQYSIIGDNTGSTLEENLGSDSNWIGGPVNGVIDPLLGPLADNGGPTATHALLPGSPAIEAGNPAIQQDLNEFDQRGDPFLRVADGDLPDDIAIDIGAYEAQSPPSADFDNDSDVDGFDFLAWQRGHGTTVGAARSDGNSDDDGDVDASDLAAWEVTFSEAAAPLATAKIGNAPAALPVAAHHDAYSVSVEMLIDLAIVVELAQELTDEQELVENDQPVAVEDLYDTAFATNYAVAVTSNTTNEDLPATASAEGDDAEGQWLADELLERVFG